MSRRRSERHNVDEDGDETMEVREATTHDADDKEEEKDVDVVMNDDGDDGEDEDDEDGIVAEGSKPSKSKRSAHDTDEEEDAPPAVAGMGDDDIDPINTMDIIDVEPEADIEVEVEANTSIGSTRPSRKAAQEATKKIEAAKAKIEDLGNKNGKGKGKGKDKAKAIMISDDEEDEEDEVEVKPKAKSKGKGKAVKDETGSDESDFEAKPVKRGGKKQILAKAAYWKDIPKWKKGAGSPLMNLPGEIMDNIFGLREELGLAEYVALAGVCKMFRHHLDDDFFQGVCDAKEKPFRSYTDQSSGHWISAPCPEKARRARTPFTRDIEDWRVPSPRRYAYNGYDKDLRKKANNVEVKHYTPRGDRSTWSRSQYTIYKEEQRFGRGQRWAERKSILNAIVKEAEEASLKREWIKNGRSRRSILAEVAGRKNGEPAVTKDQKGLPIVSDSGESEDGDSERGEESGSDNEDIQEDKSKKKAGSSTTPTRRSRSDGKPQTEEDSQPISNKANKRMPARDRKRLHVSDSEEEEDTAIRGKKGDKGETKRKTKKLKKSSEWVVPDSSGESEDELEYLREQGLDIVHDHWPSVWRNKASEKVHSKRIDKDEAIQALRVTEAQLLTLDHVLVPNYHNAKRPIQLYFHAAVQALAYRAHGGVAGHVAFVKETLANEREAKRNGTFKHQGHGQSSRDRWRDLFVAEPDRCFCMQCISRRSAPGAKYKYGYW